MTTGSTDIRGIAIGSTVIGLAGIGSLLVLYTYLRPLLEKAKNKDLRQKQQQQQQQDPDVIPDPYDKLAHICVNPADLLEITQLLQSLQKEFLVIEPRYS